MDEAYIGSIVLFAGTFAPQGWAFCWGQMLQISQYTALYSILGTNYGGNGSSTFALPDLRGAVPIGCGTPTIYGRITSTLGQYGGLSAVKLTTDNLPPHNHTFTAQTQGMNLSTAAGTGTYTIPASPNTATVTTPTDKTYLALTQDPTSGNSTPIYKEPASGDRDNVQMPGGTINIPSAAVTGTLGTIGGTTAATGAGQSINTMSPYVAMNYIIALQGLYPSRD
ncbi:MULTISPECIES: phage tail protein [Clostridium]|uniref:Phage Tail Collar Domain protein n=2 Tax=Clostridium TaxID=1485 RepID=D8GPZ1_CLOLD|nr:MULTISPECIES: tail fiber protein [Clostridium]ADK16082.1 conserved hypothetical protein [Clostridium ljungdahlii DSM 13528]AGY75265.1 tail fiber protein [Clostridium autoethanogenum DSM 10061]ALU35433.1 Tail collar domain protein [Clostridium autoethanogenum DSM 10061]OAA87042.1 Phage Tail Collar Domain protein [Clostridium ljungdahlii DSM 13528]OVY49712.1 Phage Tail Collar Domain protein [Clostridium autoethanogenum]